MGSIILEEMCFYGRDVKARLDLVAWGWVALLQGRLQDRG